MAELVQAPVVRVELFEDRAAVTRRLVLPIAGRHVLQIDGISPLVMAEHLVFPSAGAFVEQAVVHRWRVPQSEADSALAAQLDADLESLQLRLVDAERAADRAQIAVRQLDAAVDAAGTQLPRVIGEHAVAPSISAYVTLTERALEAANEAATYGEAVEDLVREVNALELRRNAARNGELVWRARLELRLVVESPGASFDVRYTIPCALWRPIHRATLIENPRRVRWDVGAMAWNATGESWQNVELVCSTARPGERATPPVLSDDVVRSRRKDATVVVEARDETIHVAREGSARTSSAALGVDDGGEARTFTAAGAIVLPSTGKPIHVALESWETPAEGAWVGLPERSPQIVLRTRQVHTGKRPILGGPVHLFRDIDGRAIGIGRGKIGFVAPGEPFALGFGSSDVLRVSRKSERKVETSRVMGHQTLTFEVQLRVANLGEERLSVQIIERIPVSEVTEVKVGVPQTQPRQDIGPDTDGKLRWNLVLESRSFREITLAYTVDAPASVRLPF